LYIEGIEYTAGHLIDTNRSLPQLGLRILSESNSWSVNGKPQNFEKDAAQYWASVRFSVGSLRSKYQVPNFQICWDL